MYISRIGISHFRNLVKVDAIDLPRDGLLVVAAPNAVGKTNFLECVAVLLRGKSFRARTENCVAWGEDSFLLDGEVSRGDNDRHRVAVRYHHPTRKLRIEEDGVPASLMSFYSHYPMVLFLPEDTFLFSRGPSSRRNLLNQVLVTHPQYVSALVQYHRVLKQRNARLKQSATLEDIASWTDLLVDHAEVLWRYREGFVTFLDDQLSEMYERLSGEQHPLTVQLVFGARRREAYTEELRQAFALEKKLGFTTVGPHRDDLYIETGGRSVKTALSRGQTRMMVIALKVLMCSYLQQVTQEPPLLLLDDVLSELDEEWQRTLLENLPSSQALLTCTTIPKTLQQKDNVFMFDVRSIVQQQPKLKTENKYVVDDAHQEHSREHAGVAHDSEEARVSVAS